MIIIDPGEASYLPPHLQTVAHAQYPIETRTGADIILSSWDAPCNTDALLDEHIRRGWGYQLKRGMDLVASVRDGRLMQQLSRMLKFWSLPWLVHVGNVRAGVGGVNLLIDGEPAYGQPFPYKAYISTVRNWQMSGGGWINLDPERDFADWALYELKRIDRDPDARIVTSAEIELIEQAPGEKALAALGGIGPARAHSLWESMSHPTFLAALVQLVDGSAAEVAKGIGPGVCNGVREFIGLGKNQVLKCEDS